MNVVRFGRMIGFVFLICTFLLISDVANASGGGWGGGSLGGGSWGGGSVGGGSWGSGGCGGCWGGSNVGYRTPVRNMLGGIRTRMASRRAARQARRGFGSGGSMGSNGSLGSVGSAYVSTSYASGGCWGSSYAQSSSGAGYGSWGSSYLNTIGSSYNGGSFSAPIETGFDVSSGLPYDYSNQGVISSGISTEAPGSIPGENLDGSRSIIDQGGAVPDGRSSDPSGIEKAPTPRPSEDAEETMIMPKSSNNAVLTLNLPRDAKVYINDRLTDTEGEIRSYVSRRLRRGKHYEYHVRAVVNRDGREVVRMQSVKLKPGIKKSVTFDFEKPAVTTLALKVPLDAKVTLSGNDTFATGRTRYYATRSLSDGQIWKDYTIRVSVVRNGKTLTREKTIDIESGQTRLVSFDFASRLFVTK